MKTPLTIGIVWLACAAAAVAQNDVLKLRNGTEVKGKVTKLTSTQVFYTDAAGKAATEKAENVLEISFSDTPTSLKSATAAVGGKNWDKAIAQCESALGEVGSNKARDFHKQWILFTWALALDGKGTPDKALEKLRALRTECGDCRLLPDSFQKSVEIARKIGDGAVESVLAEMQSQPEPMKSSAALERAKLKYAKGEFEAANQLFTPLSSSGPYVAEARLGTLRCLRALKKQAELETACAGVMSDRARSSPALIQAAAASLGDAQLRQAGTNVPKLFDALRMLSQAVAVGPPPKDQSPEDYALALLNAARCCGQLAKSIEKPESKQEYRGRATSYYSEVVSFYKGTEWATTAQKERGALSSDEKPKGP